MSKTFQQLYVEATEMPSPRIVFMKKVMDATGCSMIAVQKWCYGTKTPSAKHKQQIADLLGTEVTELFPEESL